MSGYGQFLFTLLIIGFVFYLLVNGDLVSYVAFAK